MSAEQKADEEWTHPPGRSEYFWTPVSMRLLRRLKTSKKNLIAVVGSQGSGKTSLMHALGYELANLSPPLEICCVKWSSREDVETQLRSSSWFQERVYQRYLDSLYDALKNNMGDRLFSQWLETTFGREPSEALAQWEASGRAEPLGNVLSRFKGLVEKRGEIAVEKLALRDPSAAFEKKLGESQRRKGKEVIDTIILEGLRKLHVLFIDLPDYDKPGKGKMGRDLARVQELWDRLQRAKAKTNLVIFFQRELFHGHFFIGKTDVVRLPTLAPQEMVSVYAAKFGSTSPFTDQALLEVARESRGVFRRFLRYIRLCLEYWYDHRARSSVITPAVVSEAIDDPQRFADLELELADMFPASRESRLSAFRVLECVRKNESVPQARIVEEIFDGEARKALKVLSALESYDFIDRSGRPPDRQVILKA